MKCSLLFAFLVVAIGLVNGRVPRMKLNAVDSAAIQELGRSLPSVEIPSWNHFLQFVHKFDKKYKDVEEARHRFSIFQQNLEKLSKTHKYGSAIRGVTQFFDFTRKEFRQKFLGLKLTDPKRNNDGKHDLTYEELRKYRTVQEPTSLDYRDKGYVTPVKNQGQCGSCYTFGSVQAIEGQWFKKTGKLISLSEEQALDCYSDEGFGCAGGDPLSVFNVIAELGGIESEADYSYVAGHGYPTNCTVDEKKFVAYTNGSRALPIHDEELLGKILTVESPIEINIAADSLFDYVKGILDPQDQEAEHGAEFVNHAVLLVGYGVEKDVPFWIIKNSWGTNFGEDGYFRVRRGTNRIFQATNKKFLSILRVYFVEQRMSVVLVEKVGNDKNVALVTLNRPNALNTLNRELVGELGRCLRELDAAKDVQVIILTGNGRAFCAGMDLKDALQRKESNEVDTNQTLYIPYCKKPIIAAVNGIAFGGGCELAMLCDVIWASEKAQFAQPEVKVGLIPGLGGTQRLPRIVGKSLGMEMNLSGRTLSAAEALTVGLVSQVIGHDKLISETIKLAEKIAANSSEVVRHIKECVDRSQETTLAEGLRFERFAHKAGLNSDDAVEGMKAFIQKRKPNWSKL
ncbi:hypothetical protein M3Y98_01158000 [Aphelenchoides besseyi]|nr:hypothetical protein M3Y98_01158000 [Aphelenchoides besseyi]KAI6210845.1 hypothetical protein M3Y96_00371100 [Aphelenchoides besseyi]